MLCTPTLATRAELGAYSTYIPGISRLSTYMSYLCGPIAPPLVSKALQVQQAIANNHSAHMLLFTDLKHHCCYTLDALIFISHWNDIGKAAVNPNRIKGD